MMTANEIRQKFLNFFASMDHTIVSSDSLVPKEDPTVLFTTAGMQQFKKQFLGQFVDYRRAVSCQKCLRTDDLDKVGQSDYHHTFFEMLGNFSFGGYFKKEAILWAWEFLTKIVDIPQEKLWVSVYKDDNEAKDIWLQTIQIPAHKIVLLGDKSNFWPSEAKQKGPNGPCGPCSEIFYDYGVNPHCSSSPCDPSCNCGRFSEIWNLVFTQFNRKDEGVLEALPSKNIDTGMGLERLSAVLQGKKNNYETDLFSPILKAIQKFINPDGESLTLTESCIIADHIRGIIFGITDGVVPSNEGRGYVIKKLIINAVSLIHQKERKESLLHKIVPSVIEAMRGQYPELADKSDIIAGTIQMTENAYLEVKKERLPQFQEEIKQAKNSALAQAQKAEKLGDILFTYKDTYGLALTLMSVNLDHFHLSESLKKAVYQRFEELMKRQQEKSRSASKMTGDVFLSTGPNLDSPPTKFLGYEKIEAEGNVLKILAEHKQVKEAIKGDSVQIILDQTPFYAESGGQIGDCGFLLGKNGKIRIQDTQKINNIFIHTGTVEEGSLKIDENVSAKIDTDRRLSIMRNHTATHLLQAALRKVLGTHVQQQGSLVAEDRLRFDFTHPKSLIKKDIEHIEEQVNQFILSCDAVTKEFLPLQEAQKKGALAFFAEKYGSIVRVVSIGNYSKEFCGGTHLDYTGQIGLFKITAENAIAQGIRRIEAKTGFSALKLASNQAHQLEQLAIAMKSPVEELSSRIHDQILKLKKLEKELEHFRFEAIKNSVDTLLEHAQFKGSIKIISHYFKDMEIEFLRKISDLLKQKSKSAVIVLGSSIDENVSLLIVITDDLVKKGLNANELIKEIAPLINGKGGGRPELAQAGSKEPSRLPKALEQASQIIKRKLTI